MVGEAGDREGLLHIKTVRVELVLAAGHEGSLGELLFVDDLGDVVKGVADGLAHFRGESVFLVDHGHDEEGTFAGDLEEVLALGGEDDFLSGDHCCSEVCLEVEVGKSEYGEVKVRMSRERKMSVSVCVE